MDLTIVEHPSPNRRAREPGSAPGLVPSLVPGLVIDTLVLHYTGMRSGQAAIERLCDPKAEVSAHYVVEEDGRILRLVPEALRAAHAGVSFWRGRRMLNDSSIGIEVVNPGHEWGYRPFPDAQVEAVQALCLAILSRHPIPAAAVVAHSDIAPDRKQDPGELFPWARLARRVIGLYPQDVPDLGLAEDAAEIAPVRRALARIGYDVAAAGGMDEALGTLLTAFQRHWRPEAVTGRADRGTRARLEAVARLADRQ